MSARSILFFNKLLFFGNSNSFLLSPDVLYFNTAVLKILSINILVIFLIYLDLLFSNNTAVKNLPLNIKSADISDFGI